jgi:hypothetical protein
LTIEKERNGWKEKGGFDKYLRGSTKKDISNAKPRTKLRKQDGKENSDKTRKYAKNWKKWSIIFKASGVSKYYFLFLLLWFGFN